MSGTSQNDHISRICPEKSAKIATLRTKELCIRGPASRRFWRIKGLTSAIIIMIVSTKLNYYMDFDKTKQKQNSLNEINSSDFRWALTCLIKISSDQAKILSNFMLSRYDISHHASFAKSALPPSRFNPKRCSCQCKLGLQFQ